MGWRQTVVTASTVIVYGTGTDTGLFVYNGTPGPGTLLASVTTATKDPFGNTTQPGGFVIYDGSAYVDMHVNTSVGAPAIEFVTGAASEAEHAAIYNAVVNKGAGNESLQINIAGPGSSSNNVQGWIQLVSAAADGSSLAGGVIYNDDNGTFTNFAHWNYQGFAIDAGSVRAVKSGTGTSDANPAQSEIWNTVTLSNVTSTTLARVRKLAEANMVMLEMEFSANTSANGTVIGNLPSGYFNTSHSVNLPLSFANQATGQSPHLFITTAGAVQVWGTSLGGGAGCHATYSLDA